MTGSRAGSAAAIADERPLVQLRLQVLDVDLPAALPLDPLVVAEARRNPLAAIAEVQELLGRLFADLVSELPAVYEQLGWRASEPGLVGHARRELSLAGIRLADPRLEAALVAAVLAFAGYRHAGGPGRATGSAVQVLEDLLRQRALTPLTDDRAEWTSLSALVGGKRLWQSARNPDAFSRDQGKTYELLSEDGDPETGKRRRYVSHPGPARARVWDGAETVAAGPGGHAAGGGG